MASVTEQLKDLVELRKEGVLTPAEFEEQKEILLAEARARASTPPTVGPTSAATDTSDLTGQRIGEYRLERKLGEGGMGQVYLGAHETLDQRVAVKVLDPALARSEDVRTRFIQEANIQIKLQHPGIVRVLTAHTQGEHLALVMEYVEGLSLEQALERHGRLPLDRMQPLMTQVLDAVGYAHERGVVHRDLKPSNIMVQPDGTAKVMDFGIAKVLGGAKLTRTGTLMGTAFYMSPEQVLGRSDIDHRIDIYSLGVTFFEALTGRVPFEGEGDENTDSDFLVKQAHVQSSPPDPRSFHADLPATVATTLLRALEKEPARRCPSCADFASDLGRVPATPPRSDLSRVLSGPRDDAPLAEMAGFLARGPQELDDQRAFVDSPIGSWTGRWEGQGGYVFEFEMEIDVTTGTSLRGQIEWALLRTPGLLGLFGRRKTGLRGTEYIEGAYNPAERLFEAEGYKKDDPHGILSLDRYELTLSPDGLSLRGPTAQGDGRFDAVRDGLDAPVSRPSAPDPPSIKSNSRVVVDGTYYGTAIRQRSTRWRIKYEDGNFGEEWVEADRIEPTGRVT